MKNPTKFVIISTVYNAGNWIFNNINSIKQQSYQNYNVIYGYNKSNDDSLLKLKGMCDLLNDDRFRIYESDIVGSYLKCFMSTYRYLKGNNLISPEDVIVEVDGDDWLYNSFVLDMINDIYILIMKIFG
jgi:glycosyltransferase involved in cell wall biosynthesis